MGKKLKQLAVRLTALEKVVARILSSKPSTGRKANKKKAKKAVAKITRAKPKITRKVHKKSTAVSAQVAPLAPVAKPQPVKPVAAPAPQKPARPLATSVQRPFPILSTGKTN